MVCQKCGFENEPGAEFCGSCGTFLEWAGEATADDPTVPGGPAVPAEIATLPAPAGGAPVVAPTGPVPVRTTPVQPTTGTQATAAPTPASPELIGPPCPVCAKPVPRGRTFCPHCGADTKAPQPGARAAVVDLPDPDRRRPSIGLGPIILVAAFVGVAVGAFVFLPKIIGDRGLPSQATSAPTASATPTPKPSPSASEAPTEAPTPTAESPEPSESMEPTPTPLGNEPPVGAVAKAAIISFVEEFDAAYRVGDSGFLIDHLDPAVITAYSESACRKSIESFAKSDFTTTVDSVRGPEVWTYTPKNGKSTIVSVAYTIKGDRIRAGVTKALGMHLSFKNGQFFWFASSC